MKKKNLIILIILFILLSLIVCIYAYTSNSKKDNTIPNNYILIFKGETGEIVYTTYIYEVTKKKKTTYKYINTTSTTSTYDSIATNEIINKKGSIKKKKKIFEIAKKHNAYSYVKYIKDNTIYNIEEFKSIYK